MTPSPKDAPGDALAWMESGAYLALAEKSVREKVVEPLRAAEFRSLRTE